MKLLDILNIQNLRDEQEFAALGRELARSMQEMFSRTAGRGISVKFSHVLPGRRKIGGQKKNGEFDRLVIELANFGDVPLQSVQQSLEKHASQQSLPNSVIVRFVYREGGRQ